MQKFDIRKVKVSSLCLIKNKKNFSFTSNTIDFQSMQSNVVKKFPHILSVVEDKILVKDVKKNLKIIKKIIKSKIKKMIKRIKCNHLICK